MKTRYLTLFLLALIAATSFAKEKKDIKSHGIILGLDKGACMCCGGWIIKIDSNQYRFNALPDKSTIDLKKEKFPLPVKVVWKLNIKGCQNTITIESIKKE